MRTDTVILTPHETLNTVLLYHKQAPRLCHRQTHQRINERQKRREQ
jgi:hypothetical protein